MITFHKNTANSFESTFTLDTDLLNESKNYCLDWFNSKHNTDNFFFTKSCTQSLEISLMCLELPIGSEVIIPSYAFVSLANAVNNIGLKCIFIDCEKDTMNIDSNQIEQAITTKTKAVITINYGGVACDYDKITAICKKHNLFLIEDNAHGLLSEYKGKVLGSFGDIATFSFDHMKNISTYQGGGIIINNKKLLDNYYLISEFGTNRRSLLQKKVDFYEWKHPGVNASLALPLFIILKKQLENFDVIKSTFNENWNRYYELLKPLEDKGVLTLSTIPSYAQKNAHMFWVSLNSVKEKNELKNFLKENGVESSSHYYPLHLSEYGRKVGEFRGQDCNTCIESEKLLRLPLHFLLKKNEILNMVNVVTNFFNK